MPVKKLDLTLHVLVDPKQLALDDILPFCRAIREGGATVVQLRGKNSKGLELFRYGTAFRNATAQTGLGLIINDRVDVAIAVAADGVHIGQEDLPLATVRHWAPHLVVGLSVGTVPELSVAQSSPPDYIGMGPVYSTLSKSDAGPSLGVDDFGVLCKEAQSLAPVVAIGGIQPSNAGAVWRAGADGIAVISAVMSSPNRIEACRQLLQARP